jgi:hypothetical protein
MDFKKIGRYEIKSKLGKGGMATVYLAYDPMFERDVALKILPRELMHDDQFRVRFERETKIIARLEHAAIVPVYDVGQEDGQPYFVMRAMLGGSLSDRMQSGPASLEETTRVIRRVAAALDYAHSKGIVHRDLKPANILFDETGEPFISDYGIAKLTQSETNFTGSGIIGTPSYMSPEQGQGEEIDGRSDIYSLGIIVYEMLTGKLPYEANTPLGIVFKHVTEPIPHILDVNPNLPIPTEAVIEKVLAKNRNDRFSNAMDLAVALGSLARGEVPDLDRTSPLATHLNMKALQYAAKQGQEPKATLKTTGTLPKPLLWAILGGIGILILAAVILGGVRIAAQSAEITASAVAATATFNRQAIVPLETPEMAIPTETVAAPTETATPAVALPLNIGGADGIAFVSNNNLWIMGIDGSDPQQLTSDSRPKSDLQWLPEGQKLLYIQEKCAFILSVPTRQINKVTCFNANFLDGFRVSPNGMQVAISIDRQLYIVPFNLDELGKIHDRNALASVKGCLAYQAVSAKNALWSLDGEKLALIFLLGGTGRRVAETVRVMDIHHCRDADPLILDEFPGKKFIPEGYTSTQVLPSVSWDGHELFLLNTLKRNEGYGHLYTYDMATQHEAKINPINGVCCYRDARFSPDGHYILFAFQDLTLGAASKTLIYYIPVEKIGTNTTFDPIKLPESLLADPRFAPQFALHLAPAAP